MAASLIAVIVFLCVFGSALAGLYLRSVLPEHHLSRDSQDIMKLATGLVATMAALVLGLLISSAKQSFDRINDELIHGASQMIQLDRILATYGPETSELRAAIKRNYAMTVELLGTGDESELAKLDTPEAASRSEELQIMLGELAPHNASQRLLRERALQIAAELSSTRWLVVVQANGSISIPLLMVLVAWLIVIFAAFGLFSPRNETVIAALLACSACAAGAMFLILEMDRPLDGWIRISSVPLQVALAHLGQ